MASQRFERVARPAAAPFAWLILGRKALSQYSFASLVVAPVRGYALRLGAAKRGRSYTGIPDSAGGDWLKRP